ncbi:MAG: M20/M25/M40 family metallo-hydrolase [Fimbriimonadaceae bacterium]|nr:M20/M25/M40 family metallo-hydrolase [Fimbriimonadaceae bacterium]
MSDPADLASRLGADLADQNERWTAEHTALTEIPAPPFGEGPRGAHFAQCLAACGCRDIQTDAVGNVCGRYAGSGHGPRLAISAHLDTVFGPEVDVTVRRDGDLLYAPGIGDDVSGLVLALALVDLLRQRQVELPGELWVLATVGEENVGNLRGAREVAANGLAGQPLDAFITLDSGTSGHVIRHGTWSHNLLLTLHGPGGHAWGDFGVAHPGYAAARMVARVSELVVPDDPRTCYNCGVLQAGTMPNAIPETATVHFNLRSEAAAELDHLVAEVRRLVVRELAGLNQTRRHGPPLELTEEVSGRPGGETPADSRLVRAAVAAATRLERPVSHPVSSTDANAFMAVGIPAVCVYRGQGDGVHTLGEWYDASTRPEALEQLAETVLRYFAG